jgi:hypothetical protein
MLIARVIGTTISRVEESPIDPIAWPTSGAQFAPVGDSEFS